MSTGERKIYKYYINYNVIQASKNGKTKHPQEEMKDLADQLGCEITHCSPVIIADCWLFRLKANNPWLVQAFPPEYIKVLGWSEPDEEEL